LHCLDIVDGVEDGDHVADTGDKTDTHLGKDSLGNVTTRPVNLVSNKKRDADKRY
jgi:hypothetical protein